MNINFIRHGRMLSHLGRIRVLCFPLKVEALWFGCYGVIIWFLSGKNESEWFWLFSLGDIFCARLKVGVNPSLKKEMWLLLHLLTKKTCTKMYKSIHFWNQKKQMNPMVATDFCKIMRFSRNSSVTMVTIEFFLESITKIWFY